MKNSRNHSIFSTSGSFHSLIHTQNRCADRLSQLLQILLLLAISTSVVATFMLP